MVCLAHKIFEEEGAMNFASLRRVDLGQVKRSKRKGKCEKLRERDEAHIFETDRCESERETIQEYSEYIFPSGTGEFDETEVYETIPFNLSIDVEKAKSVVHDIARSRLSNSLIQSVALLRQRKRKPVAEAENIFRCLRWISPALATLLLPPPSETAMLLSMAMMVTTPPSCIRPPLDPPPSSCLNVPF
ncbi:hypothetical protein DY000_02058127 [Brassica cretica]|uniref:Uncharacterized protein n=1 Tax=Brassica cretica TaxID=69181 RepID=A0ABQ7AKZ1_BRACR|nr:hypothetical protein DY000_02058127 [Brassica cretica]